MTQEAFGRRLGLDQGSVSRLERGKLPGIRLGKVMPVLVEMGLVRRALPIPENPMSWSATP